MLSNVVCFVLNKSYDRKYVIYKAIYPEHRAEHCRGVSNRNQARQNFTETIMLQNLY